MQMTKPLKAIADRSGRLSKMRGADISNEISETHGVKFDEQMAIAMNALESIFTFLEVQTGEDIRPQSFKEYSALRQKVKTDVDLEYNKI